MGPVTNLSRAQFGPDEPLPGMSGMRPAEPHEQTEAQFQNRPDVFWHGRFENVEHPHSAPVRPRSWDLHVGTEQAAVERMIDFGPRKPEWGDREPRFYAGRVDPSQMRNQPPEEGPHYHPGQIVHRSPLMGGGGLATIVRTADNEWRLRDRGEKWFRDKHADHYYRNEYEDPGSTSALLTARPEHGEVNFKTWRHSVSNAIREGTHVPAHVSAVYNATGGEQGPVTSHPVGYREGQHSSPYRTTEQVIHTPTGGSEWTNGIYTTSNQMIKKKKQEELLRALDK